MQRYVEVYDETGHYFTSDLKMVLTMKDFLGLDAVIPEDGVFIIANVEAIGWFADLFRADYENMGASVESLDQMLEMYLYSGEYSHSEYHPIGNLISGILDVTIIKPFVESIYGKDLITGEKLTDFERGMQFVNAVVGAVTFGQGALALDFSEMTAKEIAVELVKIWGVDAIADASAYTAGYACDELGMPAGVSFLASMLTGCTVSVGVGGYVFTDSSGKIVKELDADEMQTWLKSIDVDLDDMTGGGGYKGGRQTATTIDYSYKFDRELANFNDGYEIRTTVDKDLILVQYSSDAPDASLCYWTTVDEANGITTLNDYMDKLALSKDWGNRNTVKVARISAGTEVKYAVGTAREQLLIADPRPGGGVQYLFSQFDTDWITEIRSFSN